MTRQDIHGDRRQRPKMWVGTVLVVSVQSSGKTELILTVKMETRHPIEGPFGRVFPASVIIAGYDGLKSQDLEILRAVLHFLEKLYYPSNCRYCANRDQNLPGPAPHIWLILFQISSKSVHFWQSCCRTCEDRFCPAEYLQYTFFESYLFLFLSCLCVQLNINK